MRHQRGVSEGHQSFEGSGGGGPVKPDSYATKEELKELKSDLSYQIKLMEAHMDTKFAEVDTKIEHSRISTIAWYVGTTIAIVGIVLPVIHFLF